MIRRLASLGLCLGLTSPALAESGVQPVRLGVPAEIPSRGVLPVTANCYDVGCATLASVYVTEVGGAEVEGHFELVQTAGPERWGYFVPSEPFRPGAQYTVRSAGYAFATSVVSVSTAETTVLDETALRVSAELTRESPLSASVCCPTPPKRPQRCLDMGMVSQAVLTATVSAEQTITTQYLYELSMYAQGNPPSSPDGAFAPLLSSARPIARTVRFDGDADSYCYAVRARPMVGGDTTTLVTRCLPIEPAREGLSGRSSEEIAQWLTTCTAIPEDLDAGTLPGDQADASLDADGEALGRGAEDTLDNEDSGCQLVGGQTRAPGVIGWALALITLALAKRRRA